MINRSKFYSAIKTTFFNGKLAQSQVDGIEPIINEWKARKLTDLRWLAYMLATVYWETAKTMRPIEEYGRGAGYDYGKKLDIGQGPGKRVPYSSPDKLYYGRGYIQLTWRANYEKMSKLLGIDFLNNPEYALNPIYAVKIMFEGMLTAASAKGDFTGKSLEMYFNNKKDDPIGARAIINGKDQNEKIAGYYKGFLAALKQ